MFFPPFSNKKLSESTVALSTEQAAYPRSSSRCGRELTKLLAHSALSAETIRTELACMSSPKAHDRTLSEDPTTSEGNIILRTGLKRQTARGRENRSELPIRSRRSAGKPTKRVYKPYTFLNRLDESFPELFCTF